MRMNTTEIECKKICILRCLIAICVAISVQYVLLGFFLLFVNFNIFHPITWITETFSLIFSFYTWLCIMPLISSIIIYGIFLGKSHLSVIRYYPTRFSYIQKTILRKIISMILHCVIGFLTAWLYSRFLKDDYKVLLYDCFDGYCLNSRYMFLVLGGIYAGLYFFIKEHLYTEPELKFPIIQEYKYVRIRSQLYSTLYSSFLKSFSPTMGFTLVFWTFQSIILTYVADILRVEADENLSSLWTILTSVRLILYVWILSSQIISNMHLMDIAFTVILAQQYEFVIEKQPIGNKANEVTLVEALSLEKVPIIQHLACLDLFNLSNSKDPKRRQQIFSLSTPGGHPYNCNQLCAQCLSIINAFTVELSASIQNISALRIPRLYKNIKPTATEAAEKILLRQYNETFGIRSMMNQSCTTPQSSSALAQSVSKPQSCARVHVFFDQFQKSCTEVYNTVFKAIPGLNYLFREQEESKTLYLLSQSQDIIWLTQALAGLCSASLTEDRFGVIQSKLPDIIQALLKLKLELDKINNLNLNGKRVDRNGTALRNAVKRSLYRICTTFADYLQDFIDNPEELSILKCFVSYQDV